MPKYIDGVKKVKVKRNQKESSLKNTSKINKGVEKSASGIFYVDKVAETIKNSGDSIINTFTKAIKKDNKNLEEDEIEQFFKEEKPKLKNKESLFTANFFKITEFNEKKMAKQQAQSENKKNKILEKQKIKEQAEKERLEKIALEKNDRWEKQQKLAEDAKIYKYKIIKDKEKTKKARAKIKAEKLALKLGKREEFKKKIKEVRQKRGKKIKLFFIKIKSQSKKIFLWLALSVTVLIIIIGGLSYSVYNYPVTNDLNQILIRRFPFPAFFVNYHPVRYSLYFDDSRLLGDYYLEEFKNSKVDIDISQINTNDLVIEKIIERKILDNLADKYNIQITTEDYNEVFDRLSAKEGEDEFIDKIYNSYGLTKNLFNEKIICYIALKDKIKTYFFEDDKAHTGASLRMEKVEKLLKKNKDDFENLAEKYSEDVHALKGGDIGYIRLADMDEKLKAAITGLNLGDISEIIKEEDKYYIVKIYDIKDGRNGQEVWLKRISIFTNYSFEEYLQDLKDKAKVWNLTQF